MLSPLVVEPTVILAPAAHSAVCSEQVLGLLADTNYGHSDVISYRLLQSVTNYPTVFLAQRDSINEINQI